MFVLGVTHNLNPGGAPPLGYVPSGPIVTNGSGTMGPGQHIGNLNIGLGPVPTNPVPNHILDNGPFPDINDVPSAAPFPFSPHAKPIVPGAGPFPNPGFMGGITPPPADPFGQRILGPFLALVGHSAATLSELMTGPAVKTGFGNLPMLWERTQVFNSNE